MDNNYEEMDKFWADNSNSTYTSLGMIIWDTSVEYNIKTICSETKCPNCKSENIEKTDRKFHCLDCNFYHADYTYNKISS